MNIQKEYWENFIIDWDKSVYKSQSKGLPLREKIATYFRKILIHRMNFAINCLKPFIQNMNIIEFGCGTGRFSLELVNLGADQVEGIDISQQAIDKANQIFKNKGIPLEKYNFIVSDLCDYEAKNDNDTIIVGLGVLQYLNDDEIFKLLKDKENSRLFFEFHEKKWSILEFIHSIYRRLNKNLPFYRTLSRSHLKGLLEDCGFNDVLYCNERGVSFFTTIEEYNSSWERL